MFQNSVPAYRRLGGLVKLATLCLLVWLSQAWAKEDPFSAQVGPVKVEPVKSTSPLQVPFITWGGDIPTFFANGGLKTASGSIFQKQGLNLNLVPGDDFVAQVRDYLAGKSPFLRGTFQMIGLASEVIGQDPSTRGVVFLQLTWSAGDHMVVRDRVKTTNDLRGKTIVLQKGGPHVGMLDDILRTARIGWDDVTVVWAKDLTASPDCPAEMFKKDAKYDVCFAITPDMVGLCGGLDKTGTGAEGTIKGARVLVSTAQLSHSIADVYVCRKDFYDANKELVTRFAAAYLKGCEEVLDLKAKFESKAGSPEYKKLMELSQEIYTKQVLPTIEDAHGLVCDAVFVLHPGNKEFFTDKSILYGFDAFNAASMELALSRGYAKTRYDLLPSGMDYQSAAFTNYLSKTTATRGEFNEDALRKALGDMDSGALADGTIMIFSINFDPDQATFSTERYAADFTQVAETAAKYGNAAIAVRGHSDPTKTLSEMVNAGMSKGVLTRTGTPGSFAYTFNGQPLDLTKTADVMKAVEGGSFDGVAGNNPRETMQAALNLSLKRAEAVRDTIVEFSQKKGWRIDRKQIQPLGVGIREPVVARPTSMEQARQNMRVEFRLLRVPAEASKKSDFNF